MSNHDQKLQKLRSTITQIDCARVKTDFEEKKMALIDCREESEHVAGYIPGAIRIPRALLEFQVEKHVPDLNQTMVVYCESGVRSLLAAQTLLDLGYTNVQSMIGGIQAWKAQNFKIETDQQRPVLNTKRYGTQIRIPEIGRQGQSKLLAASVLIIGAGGLGSPVALYLAAAGVGHIGIIDHDVVDESNLQRQILHSTDRIGILKVDSAFMALRSINPEIKISRFSERLSAANAINLFKQFDIIVDGTDNFETRYLINQACYMTNRPNVHGSVFQWQGLISVFCCDSGPCYECLFPVPPTDDLAPNCAEGGVIGAATGTIGSLMACETVKLICGIKSELGHSMLSIDLKESAFEVLQVVRSETCPCCSVPRKDSVLRPIETKLCAV